MRILFVCLGNICRSPMAEALLKDYLKNKDISWHVESRATSDWEQGNPVHPGTVEVLRKRNIDTNEMFSKKITVQDAESFDFILGMDHQNVEYLVDHFPKYKDKIHLFLDGTEKFKGQDVPDPWFTGDFEETERLIDQGIEAWMTQWLKGEIYE